MAAVIDSEALFARYPILGELAPAVREEVLRDLRWITAPAGAVLFEERRPCEGFPLVVSGTVRVTKPAPNGREILLYTVEAGDSCVLSTGCLLGHVPHSARGVAATPATLALLPARAFDRLVEGHEPFRRHVFALFAERLAGLMQLVEEVAFRKLDQRLAALLARRESPVRATHQALADELGSVREIVSRLLRGFEDQGLVRLGREQVEVLEPGRLARLGAGA